MQGTGARTAPFYRSQVPRESRASIHSRLTLGILPPLVIGVAGAGQRLHPVAGPYVVLGVLGIVRCSASVVHPVLDVEGIDEGDRLLVETQLVGVEGAARHDEAIGTVGRERLPGILVVDESAHLALLRRAGFPRVRWAVRTKRSRSG